MHREQNVKLHEGSTKLWNKSSHDSIKVGFVIIGTYLSFADDLLEYLTKLIQSKIQIIYESIISTHINFIFIHDPSPYTSTGIKGV